MKVKITEEEKVLIEITQAEAYTLIMQLEDKSLTTEEKETCKTLEYVIKNELRGLV